MKINLTILNQDCFLEPYCSLFLCDACMKRAVCALSPSCFGPLWSSSSGLFGAEHGGGDARNAAAAAAACRVPLPGRDRRDVVVNCSAMRITLHGWQAIAPSTLQCSANNHARPDSRRVVALQSHPPQPATNKNATSADAVAQTSNGSNAFGVNRTFKQ